jgi:hypothetical protein
MVWATGAIVATGAGWGADKEIAAGAVVFFKTAAPAPVAVAAMAVTAAAFKKLRRLTLCSSSFLGI